MKQKYIPITSKILSINNRPQLLINNKLVPTDSYLTYIDENADYDSFNKIGFNLYSVSIFFHSRSINENTKLKSFAQGVLDSKDNIHIIDKKINLILNKNPNAYIFPRINIELSREWEKENPNELNDQPLHYGDCRICFSSNKWLNKVKEEIKTVITYIQNQDFAKNIIGYQIAGGMTEEWMTFDFNGSQGKRSVEKFNNEIKKGNYKNNKINYHKFLNDQIVNTISTLANYIKSLTNNSLIVGTFYGYSYCLTSWKFGHSSLNKLLNCKDVDFLCAPLSYWTNREVGEPCPYMVPVATLNLHNKMYFAENDTRTHLSKYYSDNPNYHTSIWKGPNELYSIEILKYHYFKALTHQTAYWWFDLWGGWYKKKSYHDLFKKLLLISKDNLKNNNQSLRQVAVIEDEEESLYDDELFSIGTNIRRNSLKNIEKSGISIDLYLVNDFDQIKNNYNCYIVIYHHLTKKIKNTIIYLEKHHCNYLVINENNYNITSKEIRQFYKKSGLKTFNFDVVVDENNNYLSIYAVCNGIIKKSPNKLIDTFTNKEVIFPIVIKKGYAYLYKKISN